MARRLYDVADARRLLSPGPVCIVSTAWRDLTNAAPIAWAAPLSMEPPFVGVVVHPYRHTADMIRNSEEFAINIPGPGLIKQTAYLGTVSGSEHNKIEEAGLEAFRGLRIQSPLLEGCLAWIECSVIDAVPTGDHTMFIGNVERVHALDEAYEVTWKLPTPSLSPLCFLGGTSYAVLGDPREAVVDIDEQGALVAETPEEREEREERRAIEAERLLHDPEAPAP